MKPQSQIAHYDTEIELCKVRIAYWLSFATSETNYNRVVQENYHRNLNRAELEKEAFEVAERHIERMQQLSEAKIKFIEELP
jgi:uncharacterized phage-like protein YoqJ